MNENNKFNVGIIGGGPAALFMLKHLLSMQDSIGSITIFEKKNVFGAGMPYSDEGARLEHVTNISGNEVPDLVKNIQKWVSTADAPFLKKYNIGSGNFNEYKVLPRLFFGEYLTAQFNLLCKQAKTKNIIVHLQPHTEITDVNFRKETQTISIHDYQQHDWNFDVVILCMGHSWPKIREGKIQGWYDSPYPPSKLSKQINYPVAIRGASLTAIDAIKTLAYTNGVFSKKPDGALSYTVNPQSQGFKIVLHSLHGLLPAIRFHLKEPKLKSESLDVEEMRAIMLLNEGFIPLSYIFEKRFKLPLREENPSLYETIKDMSVEQFVDHVMSLRESIHAFDLFKGEFAEADKSIHRRQPVYWKELLAELSYALNYPAKHFSAEDMLRLKRSLMPLISIIIAFVPQGSARELIALYDAGVLDLVAVDETSDVYPSKEGNEIIYSRATESGDREEKCYKMFVDAIGQKPVAFKDFPFEGLKKEGIVSEAFLKFRNNAEGKIHEAKDHSTVLFQEPAEYYLRVPGININDDFQVLDKYNSCRCLLYAMAVPYIAGLNPDYSGLDFCETAGSRIAASIRNRYKELLNNIIPG